MNNSITKTILLTGGAGYIGSHIALLLVQKGYQVVILDSLVHGQTWPHQWAHFIQGDCGDTQVLRSIFQNYRIDAVIHCAASIEVSESIRSPLSYYLNNVAVTLNLLQIMVHYGCSQFIFSSSCAVYGVPSYLPLNEEHPCAPLSPYGMSKYMVECMLKDAAVAHDVRFVALRYFNAAGALPEYGLGEFHQPETHLIPRVLSAALTGAPFALYGTSYPTPDGTCIRDYTHVLDIAFAHVKALEHLHAGRPSDIFNLGSGQGSSIRHVLAVAEQVLGVKIKTTLEKARAGDSPVLIADTSKAALILNWRAQHSDLALIIQSAHVYMRGMLRERMLQN